MTQRADPSSNEYFIPGRIYIITQWITTYSAYVGGRVQLHCETAPHHNIVTIWTHKDKPINSSLVASNGTLTIETVSHNKPGTV